MHLYKKLNSKLFQKNPKIRNFIAKHNEYDRDKNTMSIEELIEFKNFYQENQEIIDKCVKIQEEFKKLEEAQRLDKRQNSYWRNLVDESTTGPWLIGVILTAGGAVLFTILYLFIGLTNPVSFLPCMIMMAMVVPMLVGALIAVRISQHQAKKDFNSLFVSYPENKDSKEKPTMQFFEDKKEQLNKEIEALTQAQEKSLVSNQENEPTQSSCTRFFSARKDTVSEENNNLVIASSQKAYA